MEYTFKIREGRKTIPVAVFAESRYALAGEFLLAERSILKEITAALESDGDGELSITNEITGSSLTVNKQELKDLAQDYSDEVKRLRKRR